jgi:hypothetical protein
MALRIFETDPEAKPAPRIIFDDGTIGKLHSGKVVGNRPVALEAWRFSTGEHNVAEALAELFRAQVVDTGSEKENFLDIETESESVPVILAGPSAISSDMKQWINGKLVHHCDGIEFLSPAEDAGRACGCPVFFKDRKEAAKNYRGPAPSIKILFRLADDPELGLFAFQTGSWTLAEVLWQYEDALAEIGGEAVADLTLELVEYTTKQGRAVRYRKPVLNNIRSYNAAIAE